MIKKFIYNKMIINYLNNNDISSKGYDISCISYNCFKIKYLHKEYTLKIIKNKGEYFLYLEPYSNSYFQTKITIKDLNFKIDMTLFAIKDNEELYGRQNIKEKKRKTKKDIK